jgi:hypothetical protein
MKNAVHLRSGVAGALFGQAGGRGPGAPRRPGLAGLVRDFYTEPVAWIGLLMCTAVLTYAGGGAMFWFHAIYLGEGGPAISPWLHWLLDSSFGFVGLIPAIAVILPVAGSLALPRGDGAHTTRRSRPVRFSLVGGGLLALATAPAPLLHDGLIARGTPLADQITRLWGTGEPAVGVENEVTPAIEMAQQVGAGVAIYVPLMWVALMAVRGCARLGIPSDLRRPGAGAGGRPPVHPGDPS